MRRALSVLAAALLLACGPVHAQSSNDAPQAAQDQKTDPPPEQSDDELWEILGPDDTSESSAPASEGSGQRGAAQRDNSGQGSNPPPEQAKEPTDDALGTVPVAGETSPEKPKVPERKRGLAVIEEIVVTAQKREEAINDVPIAINAYTGDALKELGIQDTRDLGNLVPGFRYADSGNNAPIYQLRGVGFNEKSQTASSTVGVYIDEFNLPFPVLTQGANLDLERVEVLKGPQGTLYGRNTTGGAVNYIARKPTDEFETGGSVSVGRFLTTTTDGYVSGPLGDTLGVRFSVRDVRSQEGWQHSVTRYGDGSNDSRNPPPAPPGTYHVLGRKDNQAARLKVNWDPSDAWKVNFALDWWQNNDDSQAGQVIGLHPKNPQFVHPDVRDYPALSPDNRDPQLADWPVDTPRPWKLDDRFGMGSVRTEWSLTDAIAVTFLGQHVDFKGDDALPYSGLDTPNLDAYVTTRTSVSAGELRIGGATGSLDWLSGIYVSRDSAYEYDDVHVATSSAGRRAGGTSPIGDWAVTFGEQTSDVGAVFGSITWRLLDAFRLTAGARYTSEKRAYRGCVHDSPNRTEGVGYFTVFNALSLSQGGSDGIQDGECVTLDAETHDPVPPDGHRDLLKERNVSGRLALDWAPAEGILAYVSYGRGFKSGSFPVLPAASTEQYKPATQEQLNAYEIGTKTALWSGLLQLNTAAFYYDYRDKQLVGSVNDPVFGNLARITNAPKSRVYGAEFNASSNPFSTLYLGAAAAYVDTRITLFTGLNEFGEVQDFSGKPFNYAPKIQYSMVANYVYDLGSALDLSFGADYNATDVSNSSLAQIPEFTLPRYRILNARIGLGSQEGTWKMTVWGRNLTNSLVANNVLILGDAIARRVGMPMTYGLTLERQFR